MKKEFVNHKQFFVILKELNALGAELTKEEVVSEYTEGRTESLNNMQPNEWNHMISSMNMQLRNSSELFLELDKKRKKVIANMKLCGYSVDETKIWAAKQRKMPFNQLTSSELSELIYASGKVKDHFLSKGI
ncbi:MAG: hypothetical protein H0X62_12350 [Bacteroidetes bacterium]|nr:hypothetical protein [Bacteroidota bacterium]